MATQTAQRTTHKKGCARAAFEAEFAHIQRVAGFDP
jgi:hypothetical protein